MRSIAVLCLVAGCSTQPIGNENPDLTMKMPAVPLKHRPTATSCVVPRPSENCTTPDMGLMGVPSDCSGDISCNQGPNGRCTGDPHDGCHCTYDTCGTDADCMPGTLCDCRDAWWKGRPEGPSQCLPSDCRVDADCGVNGYCSPSLDPGCGVYFGVTLWHCHTAQDECVNDSDCAGVDGAYAPPFCAYKQEVGHWACTVTQCAG
jgi:hypothetical protein